MSDFDSGADGGIEVDPGGFEELGGNGYDVEQGSNESPVTPNYDDGGNDVAGGDGGCDCCVPTYDGAYESLPGSEDWAPNGSLTMLVDGERVDFGIPTLDLDGNGRPDSTIANGADGTLYLITDVTGDGAADGVFVADGNGSVLVAYSIGDDGEPVPVKVPEGTTLQQIIGEDAGTAEGDAPVGPSPAPANDEQVEIQPLDSEEQGRIGGRVVLNDGGTLIDLGPATLDLDNDGRLDSVVVNGNDGRPAWVVTEASTSGETDIVLILDPATGEVAQQLVVIDGQAQAADGADPADSGAPARPNPADAVPDPAATTSTPEKIVAPGAELAGGNWITQMTYQQTQRMYDVASEIWFGMTGGEPYPRHEDGTVYDPGQVLATLADRPETSPEDLGTLKEMIASWQKSISVWTSPSAA